MKKDAFHKQAVLPLSLALIPVVFLIALLSVNVFFTSSGLFGAYSNQWILLIASLFAVSIGGWKQVSWRRVWFEVISNLKSVRTPVFILLMVGALSGTWLLSGVIPTMVYYGLQFLRPSVFLPVAVVVSAMVSLATGSSWTTSATLGIALVGIGTALGMPPAMVAGAVISGAYFGDKMSPLSDTTNLAAALTGTDLFVHIKYMTYTTVPTFILTLSVFVFLSIQHPVTGGTDVNPLLLAIDAVFNVSPWLLAVPLAVFLLVFTGAKPLFALFSGVLMALGLALFFQRELLVGAFESVWQAFGMAVFSDLQIETQHPVLKELFASGGMKGMLWTVFLILAAMVFGGVMKAVGALDSIASSLLSTTRSVFGLFASTVFSCLGMNLLTSDQYLALVLPGKMFKKAYRDKGLASENLSRTLEDAGTLTSALIPWNTCGAYQSSVLGVSVADYFVYAVFNYLSSFTTLFFAALRIKIRARTNTADLESSTPD
jgi:NhaC family Na+:H+ antiporter